MGVDSSRTHASSMDMLTLVYEIAVNRWRRTIQMALRQMRPEEVQMARLVELKPTLDTVHNRFFSGSYHHTQAEEEAIVEIAGHIHRLDATVNGHAWNGKSGVSNPAALRTEQPLPRGSYRQAANILSHHHSVG